MSRWSDSLAVISEPTQNLLLWTIPTALFVIALVWGIAWMELRGRKKDE